MTYKSMHIQQASYLPTGRQRSYLILTVASLYSFTSHRISRYIRTPSNHHNRRSKPAIDRISRQHRFASEVAKARWEESLSLRLPLSYVRPVETVATGYISGTEGLVGKCRRLRRRCFVWRSMRSWDFWLIGRRRRILKFFGRFIIIWSSVG